MYNDRFVDVAEGRRIGYCSLWKVLRVVLLLQVQNSCCSSTTDAADSVLSVFSTAYGNLDGTDFNPNWGQSTQVEVGDNLLYTT